MSSPVQPQATRIFLDGQFQDWQNLAPAYSDPFGDFGQDEIDLDSLWITNDDKFLFFRIQFGQGNINLQSINNITFYLDSDNNTQTGLKILGLGADLQWNFGQRAGVFYTGSNSFPITHSNIGLVTMPTVSATEFEIALDRFAKPDGSTLLFANDSLRIAISSSAAQGDILPNTGETIKYSFDTTELPLIQPISIAKRDTSYLRVLSYNVARDGLLDSSRLPSFSRIFQALQPDIIGFQEIFSGTATQTADQVAEMLPLPVGMTWHASRIDPDIVVVSRFPIEQSFFVHNNGAFLLNLRPEYDSDLLLIVAHPPCCANDFARQFEIDAIMAFIRDAKKLGGTLAIEPNTPIMLIGDFNLVGSPLQLETLLTGRIINTLQHGASFTPDWDGTFFSDLLPRQTDSPMFFTWFSTMESFSPGRLDYLIFSNSILEARNSFVLFTPAMAGDTLAKHNLQANDATIASDHLPVVGDFELRMTTGAKTTEQPAIEEFILVKNYPNPFNPSTTITYTLPMRFNNAIVTLQIFNVMGGIVRTLVNQRQLAGQHRIRWDALNDQGQIVPNSVFFYRLKVGNAVKNGKMLLIQ
ncbi:MAG: endonuclease/exonuclease/phosphatase family protein [bacterium]